MSLKIFSRVARWRCDEQSAWRIVEARGFWQRLLGWMRRHAVPTNAALLLRRCAAVHTCGMHIRIDVIFLNRQGDIVRLVPGLAPWRTAACPGAWQVLEMACGEITRHRLQLGQRLTLYANCPGAPQRHPALASATRPQRVRGATLVEFIVLAAPLLSLGLAALETGRWLFARHNIDYALFEAVRAGSLGGGRLEAIGPALQQALAPLQGGGNDVAQRLAVQRRAGRQARAFASRYALPILRLQHLNPSAASFDDFSQGVGARGERRIRNSYQALQHAHQPRGLRSGQTIFEANQLHLRITYLHRALTPGLSSLVQWAARRWPAADPFVARAMQTTGALAIVMDLRMPMQSDPLEEGVHDWWLRDTGFSAAPLDASAGSWSKAGDSALPESCTEPFCWSGVHTAKSGAIAFPSPVSTNTAAPNIALPFCAAGDSACDPQCGVNYCCAPTG